MCRKSVNERKEYFRDSFVFLEKKGNEKVFISLAHSVTLFDSKQLEKMTKPWMYQNNV